MKLLWIKWKDSTSQQGGIWHDLESVKDMKPLSIVTVGYLIQESKKHITVASSITKHQVAGDICIPKSCIKSIKTLSNIEKSND